MQLRKTAALIVLLASEVHAVTIPTVPVGNVGNAPDTNGYGSVSYGYRIGTTEVTNEQYIEFLRAKAPGDSTLYSATMATQRQGGIVRSGSPGAYVYTLKPGMERMPALASWNSAARFVNWLQNGQANADMENGTYDMSLGANYFRHPGGNQWVLPNENEWYKAAYHQPAADGGDVDDYWLYATGTNAVPFSDRPGDNDAPDLSNRANVAINDSIANGYNDGYAVTGTTSAVGANMLTPVGAYTLASSYYGTYDQVGNVYELLETRGFQDSRVIRGGSWNNESNLTSFSAEGVAQTAPFITTVNLGFRVAWIGTVPEPSTYVMAAIGIVALLFARRRKRLVF